MSVKSDEQNKIIISGNRIYQEVSLADEFSDEVVIGTSKTSRIRFNADDFFCDFDIKLRNEHNGKWSVNCSRNIYIDSRSAARKYSGTLSDGGNMIFRYSDGDAELFVISFKIDFDSVECDYLKKVDLRNIKNLCIGGTDFSRIQLAGEIAYGDYITMTQQGKDYIVNVNQIKYGPYLNGREVREKVFTLRDRDFLTLDGWKFQLKDLYLYTDSKDKSIISKIGEEIIKESNNSFEYPKFIKNVRMKTIISDEKISVLSPDNKKERDKESILLILLPSVAMLILVVVLRTQMNSNPMFALYMAAMMGLGIITSFITHIRQRKKSRTDEINRVKNYTEYIKKKEKYIQTEREREIHERNKVNIDSLAEINEVKTFDYHLFEKTKEDDDFLTIRIGKGEVKAYREISVKEREYISSDDPLTDYPELLKESYDTVKNVPVTIDLKKYSVVGIKGEENELYSLMKIITLDIVSRHFYDDVKLYYKFCGNSIEKFYNFRWLKNLYNTYDYSIRNFIYDKDSEKIHFEALYKELVARSEKSETELKELPYVVVMIIDSIGFAGHPISNYIERASDLHFVFIFFEKFRERIPKETEAVIELDNRMVNLAEGAGRIFISDNKKNVQDFTYSDVSDNDIEYVCRKLACVYVDSVNLESNLTDNISLFKLLGIISDIDLDLKHRWATAEVYKSMAAPIGVKSGNSTVFLDLNEKAHGPHGLVAGTTGSGKSEILQTYILSMATLFSPEDVCFVIIDFKGGGMANQFAKLPHLIGSITNIDGEAINRSLSSINAELNKRQTCFKEYGVNHIDAYIKLYKEGIAKKPLPHLILIVDEFAELKSDQPEFMQELISTARIGRSLGVHLILATQKPAGVVNDQIWSNSKFKLCLKVQNSTDSNEVLHSPLAAEIREPGRAYLQVGNNEIFELFQSAYSGCSVDSEKSGQKTEYEIKELDLLGRGKVIYEQRNEKKDENETQLQALVRYISDYCRRQNVPVIPEICLPEIPKKVTEEQMSEMDYICLPDYKDKSGILVDIGIYDDPDHQEQKHYMLNLSDGHTVIIGAPQTGKTNILQQILRNVMIHRNPRDVNVYILDFASAVLKNYESSAFVGGVVTASDDEKFKHFLNLMESEIIKRKEKLTEKGLSSFSAYKEAGNSDIPQIIVLVDNYLGVKELYLQREDSLLPLLREGVSLGISFVVTDIQTSSLGFRYMSLFKNKIALYCNSDSEYSSLFGICRKKLRNISGRCIVEIDRKLFFMQSFIAYEGEREIDRVGRMRQEIEDSNVNTLGSFALRIPEVPEQFTEELLFNMMESGYENKKYCPVFGVDFDTAGPDCMNFADDGVLGVVGGDETVRVKWVKNLIMQLYSEGDFRCTVFDGYKKSFKRLFSEELQQYVEIIPESDRIREVFNNYITEAEADSAKIKDNYDYINEIPLKLLIINDSDVIDMINKDRTLLEIYKNLIGKYRVTKIMVIITCIDDVKQGYTNADVQKSVLDARNIMLLNSVNQIRIMDIPPSVKRDYVKPLSKTEGLYYRDGEFKKYKLLV